VKDEAIGKTRAGGQKAEGNQRESPKYSFKVMGYFIGEFSVYIGFPKIFPIFFSQFFRCFVFGKSVGNKKKKR